MFGGEETKKNEELVCVWGMKENCKPLVPVRFHFSPVDFLVFLARPGEGGGGGGGRARCPLNYVKFFPPSLENIKKIQR